MTLKKKTFFLAVNTGLSSNSSPNEDCIEFYRERSGNNIDCSIVGNVVITDGFGTNHACSTISDDPAWAELAKSISNNGSIAGIQLSSTWEGYEGIKSFVASREASPIDDYIKKTSNITPFQIEKIISDLKNSINLSIQAGFTHIQIHAAHGYLFSLLIDPYFCQYSELFQKELKVITLELRNLNIESSIRFSLITGSQVVDRHRNSLIQEIMELGFDYFDVSFGFYNINKNLIYPVSVSALKSRWSKTVKLAEANRNQSIIASGKLSREVLAILPDNVHFGYCRDLIANPKFLTENNGKGCNDCGDCHYYSQGNDHLVCGTFSR